MRIGDYTLVYRSLDERASANATRDPRDARRPARRSRPRHARRPGKNAYTIEQQVSNEVGIRSDRLTGEDLFVIAEQIDPDGSIYFRVFVKPLVNLIWLAGLVFLHRLADHAVARPARAAEARRARVRGRTPRNALTLALVLAAALAVACVVAVALPFLREPEPESDALDELDDDERRRLELLEERDRALSALKELEFDHRTGTVSDEDYRAQVGAAAPRRRVGAPGARTRFGGGSTAGERN